MRSLDAVFEDATALFADAAALMHRARSIRQELEAATARGADEAERLVHGAIVAWIEGGLVQADMSGPINAFLKGPARQSGTMTFMALLDTAEEQTIYAASGAGPLTPIASTGDHLDVFSLLPSINDSGTVAFEAVLAGGGRGEWLGPRRWSRACPGLRSPGGLDRAMFGSFEARRGFHHGDGGCTAGQQVNTCGVRVAMQLVLTAEPIDAQRALQCNLIMKVAAHDRLLEEAELVARQILRNPQRAVRSAKETILEVIGKPLDDQLRIEGWNSYTNSYTCLDRDEARTLLQRFYDR